MYRTIIKLKKDIPTDQLATLTQTVVNNYSNRAGTVENSSNDPYTFVFEGDGETVFECLDLGTAMLAESDFIENVADWQYIDEDYPSENCDILKLYLYGEE